MFSYNAWVTILDEKSKPNNGPFEATRTIITVDSSRRKPTEHFDFILYGPVMKFIQRGAVRIESTQGTRSLAKVAFRNPDSSSVLVPVNDARGKTTRLSYDEQSASVFLPAHSVATFVWQPT